MFNDLITIVIPIYNIVNYIDECLNSIICQSYHNLEIILVDDGSDDGSGAKCDDWKSKDDRIIVIHTFHGGPSAARNAALSIAKGKYITFIDGDDRIHSSFVHSLYSELVRNDAQISFCEVQYDFGDQEYSLTDNCDYSVECLSEDLIWERFLEGDRVCDLNIICNKLFDLSLFDSVSFPVGRKHEDDSTTYKLLYHSSLIVSVHKKMYFYRQREGSIVHKKMNIRRCVDIIDAQNERINFFKKFIYKYYNRIVFFELARSIYVMKDAPYMERKLIKYSWKKKYKNIHKELCLYDKFRFLVLLYFPYIFIFYENIKRS